ncbi:hypothetical protein CO038_04760 [Candidatus Pacearchaeota archaeon CG_4_9_14_0_2_um_filter_39_13]|nr:hypothetical protein [Candidatus Pacearchaeota archaeon]PJC44240.1 MAG: hypothetical protein CO038_04760 [Candidatus Pacearchaeota archaeon CG_4_9_14_0_2_um_filter_39_13]
MRDEYSISSRGLKGILSVAVLGGSLMLEGCRYNESSGVDEFNRRLDEDPLSVFGEIPDALEDMNEYEREHGEGSLRKVLK